MTQEIKASELTVRVAQEDAYRFQVTFDKNFTPIVVDEPLPLGRTRDPTPLVFSQVPSGTASRRASSSASASEA